MQKKKVLFLCHSLGVGGIETYLLRFCRWLTARHPQFEIHIICKSGVFGTYEGNFLHTGVTLHGMPIGYLDPSAHVKFYRFLKINRFEAVCDFGGNFGGLTNLVAWAARVPKRLVYFAAAKSAYKPTPFRRLYQRFLNRLVCTFSTNILSNSQAAFVNFFSDQLDGRFQVIRNGVPVAPSISLEQKEDLRSDLGLESGQKVVLHVGSARWEKNHECIIHMADLAQKDGLNACFCLVGPGVENAWKSMCDALNLTNIRFLGERRDVGQLLQIADVFLFPSLSEGQPNAFQEALVGGVPFVASDIAPIRETLSNDWGNRWLFSPHSPEQGCRLLTAHLANNPKNDSQFHQLVSWAKVTFEQDRCFNKFLKALENLNQS
jgi:glycosyltransferase involved in cell wall biosynthesis